MREDRRHQFGLGGLERLGNGIALNELGHFGADHMRAKELSRLGVEQRLDQALRLAERDRLAIADEGIASDLETHGPRPSLWLR